MVVWGVEILHVHSKLLLCYSQGGGVKLWDVDMNRSRTFTLDSNVGVVRAICRSKVSKHMYHANVPNVDTTHPHLSHRARSLWAYRTASC